MYLGTTLNKSILEALQIWFGNGVETVVGQLQSISFYLGNMVNVDDQGAVALNKIFWKICQDGFE